MNEMTPVSEPQTSSTPPLVAGRYLRYPDQTGARKAEGGRRISAGAAPSAPDPSGMPRVSIITVCWNSEATLEQAMLSVQAQTYPNIEHVVVDGGSSDGTLDILARHAAHIDYYVSEPDGGIYFAMNKGLELAQGAFILFLNSDDWYEPRAVEKLVRAQQDSGADVVSALANYVDEAGKFVRVQPLSPFDPGVDFRMPLRHETMLVPASLYNEVGPYDVSYRIIADRVYTAGLFWRGITHHHLRDPLLNFRMSGTSSVDLDKLYDERERTISTRFPGLSVMALRDLVDLERMSLDRLCQIARSYGAPEFRASAVAYALDREAQGHKAWQDVNVDAFSPVVRTRPAQNRDVAAERRRLATEPAPMVSVILPIYNAEDTLAECLESLQAQSLNDFEVICLNDQSPDGSQAIVDRFVARDPRIKSRINENNVGLGSTRNRGIAVARGRYIFHIDPDDVIPPDALKVLVAQAERDGSDMVRGAFLHQQLLMGQVSKAVRKGIDPATGPIVNTTLAATPELLKSTEGHWSFLYRADFAKRVFYPEDLKMGQDSIFLVQALTRARRVSVIADVIYHYRANPNSAMNVFSFRKYIDEIEWRQRAWHELTRCGFGEIGDFMLCSYWNFPFFETLDAQFKADQKAEFWRRLAVAFRTAGNLDLSKTRNPTLKQLFQARLAHFAKVKPPVVAADGDVLPESERLRVVVLSTSDHGGAGLAALRAVKGLRAQGHDAQLYTLFKHGDGDFQWPLPLLDRHHRHTTDDKALHQVWQRMAVLNQTEAPGLIAREMVSKSGNLSDPVALQAAIREADVVHLHWVSGIIDFDHMPEMIGDTPLVWTLHDMNPMTGGCHYAEGCEGYQQSCQDCPLLSGQTDLMHRAWRKKKKAFDAIPSIDVVCPSDWLAQKARESTLFADRPVHMIPNIFPVEDFSPTNKMAARAQLNLPLDKKLIVFGADSLANRRKGGDILRDSLAHLHRMGAADGVEGVFFGASNLDLNLRVHNMGYVHDPKVLSLIYAAADAFAFPSREDNAPQTVIEALLSATPVVGFPVGNVPDTVRHKETGYIAAYEDAEDFAKGLAWALGRNADGSPDGTTAEQRRWRGVQSRAEALAHNDPARAVARHIDLYRSRLSDRAHPRPEAEQISYGVLGASLSHQGIHHKTGERKGYVTHLQRDHAVRIGSASRQITRYCYPGNRLMDAGLIRLQHLIAARPDVCLFEPLIENGARGQAPTLDEMRHVYGALIRNGIVPVTFMVPLPLDGPSLGGFPNGLTAQQVCKEYGLPLCIADTRAIAATGATFEGVHTSAESGALLAEQCAQFLEGLDIPALKAHCATLNVPPPHIFAQRLDPPHRAQLGHIRVQITPQQPGPLRLRLVQNHEVGPHSPVLDVTARLQGSDTVLAGQTVSVWDNHCHYVREAYVILLDDTRIDAADPASPIEIDVAYATALPDYASCRRSGITWPSQDQLTLRPRGALHIFADHPLTARILTYD